MANEYYERLSEMNPGDLADGLAMEAEFDAIAQGFSKLPTPHTGGQGFDGPVRVGDAVNNDEAVSLGQLNAAIGEAVLLPIATYGNLNAAEWGTLPSNTYLLFGTGAQFSNTPYTMVAGSTYYLQVRHVIGGVVVSIYHDQISLASTNDAANADLRRLFVRTGATFAGAVSGGWLGFSLKKEALTALESLIPSADRLAYYTDSGAAALTTLTAFARTLLDDADAAAALVTLGAFPRAGGGIAGDFWSSGAGTSRFGLVDNLGWSAEGKSCLVLLAKKYVGTTLNKMGFVGRIFFNRGAAGNTLQSDYVDLNVTVAYIQNASRMLRRSGATVSGAKIVEVTHGGDVYLALYRPASSSSEVVVTGHAFDSSLPLLIADATAYSTTDVVTTEEDYYRGNILGKVSQSGGYPTGAIIERGSNANGEYTKFADGTLICTKVVPDGSLVCACTTQTGSLFYTAGGFYDWTLPTAFINSSFFAHMSGAINTGNSESVSFWTLPRSATAAGMYAALGRSGTAPLNIGRFFAIGRWY